MDWLCGGSRWELFEWWGLCFCFITHRLLLSSYCFISMKENGKVSLEVVFQEKGSQSSFQIISLFKYPYPTSLWHKIDFLSPDSFHRTIFFPFYFQKIQYIMKVIQSHTSVRWECNETLSPRHHMDQLVKILNEFFFQEDCQNIVQICYHKCW